MLESNETWQIEKMFLKPGEIVGSFSVGVEIGVDDHCASEQMLETEVFASILGDISNETLTEEQGIERQFIDFNMNTREQAHYFGSSGFYGTVTILFR